MWLYGEKNAKKASSYRLLAFSLGLLSSFLEQVVHLEPDIF